jgi:A/G-specific adenine glycosylase
MDTFFIFDAAQVERLQDSLLRWAKRHLRPLPWRAERRDPYAVWVAEVMLQQTRAETAAPYFQRWLQRFPDVHALASAAPEDVLKAWEGLGYYSRARNLRAAAQIVVSEHGGEVPQTRRALESLPGIGRYTAGAILSIAYGQDEPVLDGNVRRVLSRLLAISEATASMQDALLWEAAIRLLPAGRAGAFNEGLMELGATVCTPRSPACADCPWQSFCTARAQGRQETFPPKRPRKKIPHYHVTAAVICDGAGRVLVAQRPPTEMLGGLWEFPGGKVESGESLHACLRREIEEELGVSILVGERLTVVKHAYSHFRITLHAFFAQILDGTPQAIGCAAWRWIRPEEADGLAFSAADLRILDALNKRVQPVRQ